MFILDKTIVLSNTEVTEVFDKKNFTGIVREKSCLEGAGNRMSSMNTYTKDHLLQYFLLQHTGNYINAQT